MSIRWFSYYSVICVLLLIASTPGCRGRLQKSSSVPNTFKFTPHGESHILGVRVTEETASGNLVWEIEPVVHVPARGFTVTVGVIPYGFRQVYPEVGSPRIITGEKYVINMAVFVDFDISPFFIETWTAQDATGSE